MVSPGFSLAKSLLLIAAVAPFCLAQSWPFDPGYAATVESTAGQVVTLRDGQEWALSKGDSIQPGRVIVTGPDGYALLRVSDGSTFEVFPKSKVVFRTNPGNWRDLLDVFIGRVKVHIQKFGGKPNHNRVTTPTAVISVRGTTFDVVVEDDAEVTLVAVEEGAVEVEHALLPSGEPKTLKAGDHVRVYRRQPLASSKVRRDAVVQHALRGLADAMYTIILRTPRVGGGARLPGGIPGGGSGGGIPLPGDTGAGAPPPPPPPPPPPAQ